MYGAGQQTRERILDAAERLFAQRGVAAVSLREIRLAAGARNTAAVQFHFGDRDGVIDGLIARHMPAIGARQAELAAEADPDDTRALLEVLVRPVMEYAEQGPSQRAWVKIMAELAALPDLYLGDMSEIAPEPGRHAAAALYRHIARFLPSDVARERIIMMADISTRICGVYARLTDEGESRPHLSAEAYTANLLDMLHAALFAPATEPVR